MRCRIVRFAATVGIAWGLAFGWWAGVVCAAAEPKPLPSFGDVREIVVRHFALLPHHRPGDMIARSEVAPLFAQLQWIGWTVVDRKHILAKVPTGSDFLNQKLRTPRGRKLMRRIADYPNAYDRLERLSWLPHGKQTVHDLIYKAGGDEMIKHLTTSAGGKEMGKMFPNASKGADFNKPTGRIYTVKMLLARLEKSHTAAAKAALGKEAAKQ